MKQSSDFENFHREKTEERTKKIFDMEMEFLESKHDLLRSELKFLYRIKGIICAVIPTMRKFFFRL